MVPNLENMNNRNKNDILTSKTFRVGRFILENEKYTSVMMDIVKGDYERNDWYFNVFS